MMDRRLCIYLDRKRGGLEDVDTYNLALAKASMQRHEARSVIDVPRVADFEP